MEYGNGETNQLVWRETENKYHNEEFEVKADNPNVNVAMVSQYVRVGERVLDIGCGEGKFGKVVCDKNCLLYGVDIDQRAGKIAVEENGYNEVFVFNFEKFSDFPEEFGKFEMEDLKFDKIVLLDVLEHVMNPTAVIYNAIKFLKNNGKLLISVPNVNNGDIFLNLLRDSFHYREAGVLDNTHTKYFTKTSFVQWIKEINDLNPWSLDCEYIGSTFAYTNYMKEVKEKFPFVYGFIQQNPYFHVMQHMFVLTYFEEKTETLALNKLFEEKQVNLISTLEELLSQSEKTELLENAKLLPNERDILEGKVESAQSGWEKSAKSLKELEAFSDSQSQAIVELKNELKKKEEEILEIKRKWAECAEALKGTQEDLERTEKGWKECAEALKETKEDLERTKKGWKNVLRRYKN